MMYIEEGTKQTYDRSQGILLVVYLPNRVFCFHHSSFLHNTLFILLSIEILSDINDDDDYNTLYIYIESRILYRPKT